MEFKHDFHQHLLLQNEKGSDFPKCKACANACVGPTYSCTDCGFHLHESCSQLPKNLENYPLHQHSLSLKPERFFMCDACAIWMSGFSFRCDQCNLSLDVHCAFMRPAIEEMDEQLGTHFRHHHPWVHLENFPKNHISCCVCGRCCSDPSSYGCLKCHLFFHPSCFKLKLLPEIQHFYHPHSLTLYTYTDFIDRSGYNFCCGACQQLCPKWTFYYGCNDCGFRMDINCSLLPTMESENSEQQICHVLHGHPLSLFKITEGHQLNCFVCKKGCTDPTYACDRTFCQIKASIHKSCLDLPQEIICHPFHPYHSLTLLHHIPPLEKCNACRKVINPAFGYKCQSGDCSFLLHVECSMIRNAIKYEGHSHILQFKDNISDQSMKYCIDCNSPCESYAFSCLYCDIDFDLPCGPLPHKIKHRCHLHTLILTHGLAEHHEDASDDEFYCDVCEEKRDPLLPNYQCTECQFVAEITCVVSEVQASLHGEYGDQIELKDRFERLGKMITTNTVKEMVLRKKEIRVEPALTLYDILSSFSEDEKHELDNVLKVGGMETPSIENTLAYDYDEVLESSDRAYENFLKFLDQYGTRLHIDYLHKRFSRQDISDDMFPTRLALKEGVVNVGDYMVTRKLAPILKDLLSKHEDICVDSTLSPKVKIYLFNMLCECIHSMKNHYIVKITDVLLLNWWGSLKILNFAGFRVKFASDRLWRVAHAHFDLKVGNKLAHATDKLNGDIAELYEKIRTLENKRERIIISAKSSSYIEECPDEASVLKLDKAGSKLL